jgi:hypothetical protein
MSRNGTDLGGPDPGALRNIMSMSVSASACHLNWGPRGGRIAGGRPES